MTGSTGGAPPDGWAVARLSDIATTQLGKTINPREKAGPRQRKYLRNANVQWGYVDLYDVATMHFSREDEERYSVTPGDLLVCEGGVIGRGAIWQGDEAYCFQNALHRVRPLDDRVSAEWLLENLRMLAANGRLAERARGNTILHLSQEAIRSLPIVVPPADLQRGLVNLLQSARERTATAVVHLDDAMHKLQSARRALIVRATTGELTADWRAARHVPDAEDGLPQGWIRGTVSDTADCLDNLRKPINADERSRRKGDVPYYGANGQVGWIDRPIFDESLVLVVEDETFTGRTRPFSYVIAGPAWVNNHAHVLRPRTPLTTEMLNTLLSYYDFVPLTSGSTGRRKLTKSALMTAPVAIPPEDEQQVLLARLTEGLARIADAEVLLGKTRSRLLRIDQSILAKVFRGELGVLA
jgi:type I restriction enzyme S subunit